MKKRLQLLIALFTFAFASAQDFSLGDYGYTIDGINVKVQGYTGGGGDITILDEVESGGVTYPVTTIGANAFKDKVSIDNVILPTTVTVLEDGAFTGCTGIVTINCDNIVELGVGSLSGLTSLTDYGTFNSLTTMASNSFFNLNSLTEFELPASLTVYNIGVGNTFSSVQTFNIPSTVVSINNAFFRFVPLIALQANWSADQLNGTNGETAVDIKTKNFLGGQTRSTITLYVPVGTKAAYDAHSLLGSFNVVEGTLADLDNTVGTTFTEGDYDYKITSSDPLEAEVSGSALINLNIPATATNSATSTTYAITGVGNNAFDGNTDILSVILPSSVVKLGSSSFANAPNLASINLENVTLTGASAFASCTGLTTVAPSNILTSAITLGQYTFFNCTSLTTLSTPVATSYGEGFLRASGIVSFNIPSTVISFGNQLFRGALSLTTVTLNWQDPSEATFTDETNTFGNLTEANITINVPLGTVGLYQAATPWNEITNITDGSVTLSANVIGENILDVSLNNGIITVTNGSSNTSIAVYDITGKLLVTETAISVNTSDLNSGIYIVKVVNGSEKLVKRFVIN